jgi:hypothetical protein
LGQQIIIGNKNGGNPQVNFKGIFVGNPYTDPVENSIGEYDTWYGHQMVSLPAWKQWYVACQNGNATNAACAQAEALLNEEIGDVDPYALDYPVCEEALGGSEREQFLRLVVKGANGRPVPQYYEKRFAKIEAEREVYRRRLQGGFPVSPNYDPCAQNHATLYLNEPDVQSAIHAVPTLWTDCSFKIAYSPESMRNPMEPTWKWLVAQNSGARFTIVSGDDDSVCGTAGTQSWVWNLGYGVQSNWQPWLYEGQVAGYLTKFQTTGSSKRPALNLVTVHSAGHLIPQTQPERSLASFTNYLKGVF